MLRADAPQIRTADAIIQKHEQIQDALERQAINGKIAEQMNQTLKGIVNVVRLEMQFHSLAAKLGRRAFVPRSPLLRNIIGLGEQPAETDGAYVRGLVGEK